MRSKTDGIDEDRRARGDQRRRDEERRKRRRREAARLRRLAARGWASFMDDAPPSASFPLYRQ